MLIFLRNATGFCYPAVTVTLASIPAVPFAKSHVVPSILADLLRSSMYRNHTDPCASKEGSGLC